MNQTHSQVGGASIRTEDEREVIQRAVRFLESGMHTTIARDTMASELRKLLAPRATEGAQAGQTDGQVPAWLTKEVVIETAFDAGLGHSAQHPSHFPAYARFAELVAQATLARATSALMNSLPVALNEFRHNDVTYTHYKPDYSGSAALVAKGYKPMPLVYLKDALAVLWSSASTPLSAGESANDAAIRGPLTDAQRNDIRAYAGTLHGGQIGHFDDIIRQAAVAGYMNGRHDFANPAGPVVYADGFKGGVDCPECGVGTEHDPGCERHPDNIAADQQTEPVRYEYQPRHENGMLLDWAPLPHAETDQEAQDYCVPRGFKWRRATTQAVQALTPLDYRAQGREEVLATILAQDPENPFAECTETNPNGDAGDFSTSWNETKLRELLHIGDSKHDAFGRAEAMYYEAQGHKSEAEREKRFVAQAPFYQPLHDFLSKHQAWDLMGDLKRAAGEMPQPASVDIEALRSLPWEDQSTADPVEKARRVLGHLIKPDIVYFYDDGFPRNDSIKKGAQNVLTVLNAFAGAAPADM